MPMRTITPTTARRLAISCQQLAGSRPSADEAGIMAVFRELGCVQIDPLRAVERTQLLVLWSRLGKFDPADLEKLLYQDRRLFEYWAHAASIVLTDDYPIYQLHMRDWLVGEEGWKIRFREWLDENDDLRQYVLNELIKNGPLSSRHFKDQSQKSWESSGWTSGQNVSQILSGLWRLGQIMVHSRMGLTKYYELTVRCLPDWTPREEIEWPEAVYNSTQHSLRALGLAKAAHINDYFTRGRYPGLPETLAKLEAEEQVIQVQIKEEGDTWPGIWYVHADKLPLLEQIENGEWEPRTTLLSPFDNFICDRNRIEELFNFHYRIEIYVPKAKREYGYYVLPILHGDRLIGRLDPKMDRKNKRLNVFAVYAEPEAPMDPETGRSVLGSIEELADFLGAHDISFEGQTPGGWGLT